MNNFMRTEPKITGYDDFGSVSIQAHNMLIMRILSFNNIAYRTKPKNFFQKKLQKYLHSLKMCITFAIANGKEVKRKTPSQELLEIRCGSSAG